MEKNQRVTSKRTQIGILMSADVKNWKDTGKGSMNGCTIAAGCLVFLGEKGKQKKISFSLNQVENRFLYTSIARVLLGVKGYNRNIC